MCEIEEKLVGDDWLRLNPIKTINAVRAGNVPPKICLACSGSDKNGVCTSNTTDMAVLRSRWQDSLVVDSDTFEESLNPEISSAEICGEYLPDDSA